MFRAGGPSRGASPEFTGPVVLMADVSEWQPSLADAAYLAWSRAVVIRALYGADHQDAAWYGGQRRAGLHKGGALFVGIYAYLVAGQSGASQAQAFRDLVGAIQPGEVFIADLEQGDHALLTAWYDKMIALYGTAIRPYLWTYTGLWFGGQAGILPVQWIADYSAAEPSTPHKLWQFSESYSVPGVGTCDCSLFHGTIGELAALAYQVPKPAPVPPADWTFGPPQRLQALAGHTSVRLSWEAPAGAPEVPAEYLVYVYSGEVCNRTTLLASYPRTAKASPWEGGGLERGRQYTTHVVAAAAEGSRVRPYTYATATFTTG